MISAVTGVAAAASGLSAAALLFASHRDAAPLESSCRVIIPTGRGTFERTLDPGVHVTPARQAAAAVNSAHSALQIRLVAPGAPADIRVAADADLPGRLIGRTHGCLGAGRASYAATITLEARPPASVDVTEIIARQLAGIAGITQPTGRCSALIFDQTAFKAACGTGYQLLSSSDLVAIRRIWGVAPALPHTSTTTTPAAPAEKGPR